MKHTAPLLVALFVAFAAPAAAAPAAKPDPARAVQPKPAAVTSPPMVFYLAKGEPDSCGTGCDEWIAAEGQIDSGAAQRLRTALAGFGKRKLPIFFNSPGGLVNEAAAIGRLLHEREMTAGVSETIPAGCAVASAQACQALKRSGQAVASEL